MKTKTATKTKTKTPREVFRAIRGIGFDTATCEHGSLRNNPAVVVAVHPIHGMAVYGPFIELSAARAWMDTDADMEIGCCHGTARGWTFHAMQTDVPGRWM